MAPGAITANENIAVDLTKTFVGNERRMFAAQGWHGTADITVNGTAADAPGGDVTLSVYGATPGATIAFQRGTVEKLQPFPGCPGKQTVLADPVAIGSDVADANGLATVTFFVPSSSLGSTVLFHASDAENCETSNVEVHSYY